jgi:putative transposase
VLVSRARKRPKGAPTFIASFPLEVTAAQRAEITKRFDAAGRLYNACLGEARDRARRMRADPCWEQARKLPPGPEKAARFTALRTEYAFSERELMSFASGCRVAWLREKVFSQEAQVLGRRAYEAVNDWLIGKHGKPRFKNPKSRGLHSLECKDVRGALRISEMPDGRVGLQWGKGMVLPFRLDEGDPCQWWAACHVADDRLLRCRIVRTMVNGRWAFAAQLVLDGHALQGHETGVELIGVDVGPSEIAIVGDTGAFKERFCDELADHDREIRRLQRRLDRQHRAASPGCFDEKGRHRKGGCDWKQRSKRARQTQAKVADARRRLAAHRKSLQGGLANRILGQGVVIKAEKLSYKAFQRSFGRSVTRRAPGMFMELLARKAASAGGRVIDVNTRTTALSQTCVCGRKERKPLSQRTHRCDCGVVCDRDVFSGFLVRHVDTDAAEVHCLDVASAKLEWRARRDGIRDWPASKRSNRRVPPASLAGHLRGSEPVGHTGTHHRRTRPPADPGQDGTAA